MSEHNKPAVHASLPQKWKRKLFIEPIEALTDPIPEDEENHGGPSPESSSTQKKGDSDTMEDDIENQRRALSGIDASTSSIEPSIGTDDENSKKKHKDSVLHSKTSGDIESQSVTETRRYGYLGDSEISITSHAHTVHSPYSPPSSARPPTQHTDPGEEVVEATKPAKKERSSWDFEADDTFKFESGGPIPEPEKPPDPPPIFAPPFVRNKNDFRAKLMHLSELTLPPSPAGPEPDLPALPPNEYEQLQVVSTPDDMVGDLPPLTSRRKPPRPVARSKTRLQDPPPMTPAVSDQLASIWSDASRSSRRSSLIHQPVDDEGQGSRFGPVTSRRFSATVTSPEGEQLQNLMQSRLSRKAVLLSATVSATSTNPEKPPEKTASRLGMFSPSVMFSSSRLGLLSKSKANIQQPPPPPEEEPDPLDDDSIPRYKKYTSEQHRWLVWIQWIGLFILIVILILAIKLNKLQMVIWKEIQLWQWLALATVVISGRLIAGWLVMILVALIERHYILKKRVLYFVYGLRHAVKNVVWLALVIGVWKLVFRHVETKGNIPIVTKVLWCLFTTACLWMAKILAVKVAANSFHRAAYFDRVQDCLFHQYVLETLSAPRRYEMDQGGHLQNTAVEPHQPTQAQQELEALLEPDVLDPDSSSEPVKPKEELLAPPLPEPVGLPETHGETERASHLASGASRLDLGSSMASPSRANLAAAASHSPSRNNLRVSSMANMGPYSQASQLPSPTGTRLRRITGADGQTSAILARSASPIQHEKLQELTSETVSAWTMKRLMKMIRKTNIATFSSILDQEAGERIDSEAQAKAAAKQIFYNIARPGEKFLTLTDFLYFLPEDQATRAFALFEVNDLGQITKKALMKWVVNIYKERRALALTLSDNRTVVAKLHRVLDVLLLAVAVTICFLIMGVNTQKLIVGFSSVLLPSVFVFGNAARSTFESLIFLFVMHPFDVGDRICVDGHPMIVEEMNILNTILLSGSNEKIYYPNSVLATKAISNYYRSPDQWDSIDFQIHATTPVEQLGLLKERMTKYIESLPQFWYPVFRIVCKDIEDSTRMKMALWVQHHLNYQESGERWQRRSNMILHMKTQLEDLGIGFHLPRQEITVTGVPVLDVPLHRSQPTPM